MAVRILIADDHSFIRAGLRAILKAQPDFEIVGEAADGNEALRLAHELRPEVVVTDISMPGPTGGGLTVVRRLSAAFPHMRLIVLTVHEDEGLLHEALRAGAVGYVIKRAAETELVSAIQAARNGDVYVHPAMTRALFREPTKPAASQSGPIESLSARELEILRLLARGHTSRQIGEMLDLSTRTVEGHRSNLMSKLNLHDRLELTTFAEEHGLLD